MRPSEMGAVAELKGWLLRETPLVPKAVSEHCHLTVERGLHT